MHCILVFGNDRPVVLSETKKAILIRQQRASSSCEASPIHPCATDGPAYRAFYSFGAQAYTDVSDQLILVSFQCSDKI